MRKLRLLISSNGHHTPSGYGSQLAEVVHPMNKDVDVAVSSFYGLQGGKTTIDGITTYPAIDGDMWGMQAMALHAKDYQADAIITNQDTWVLDPNWMSTQQRLIPWVPIDHNPVPEAVVDRMKLSYRIITYSHYGQSQLESHGLASTYIPMGVNTKIFKPMDKVKMREQFKFPKDAFIVGMVAANRDNPSRKSFQEVIDAFVVFLKDHPNAYLALHTVIDAPGGFPIRDYCKFLGIESRLLYHDHYEVLFNFPKKRVAELINTFDILVNPSRSEGFGIPIVEAQACGVPVVVTNFTSMPELVIEGKTGLYVDPVSLYFTPIGAYIANVHPKEVYTRMEELYKMDRVKMGEVARKFIVNKFDTESIYKNHWQPFFDVLTQELVR